MFSSFKNKPYAQEIIGNDPAACGKNITQRIMYSVKISFTGKEMGDCRTEKFKTPDFNNGAKPSCNYEE